jgi:hypothetical protein
VSEEDDRPRNLSGHIIEDFASHRRARSSQMDDQLALAMAVQRYRMSQAVERPAKPQLSATLRPQEGVVVKLEKRI